MADPADLTSALVDILMQAQERGVQDAQPEGDEAIRLLWQDGTSWLLTLSRMEQESS